MEKVNLREKFALFSEHWRPKIVGELNGQHVKLVKFAGPFAWHHHNEEDELFLVVRGWFTMEFRDRSVRLDAGEFLIVPRGVEHRPVAGEEVEVLLFEPAGTLNTGNVRNEFTAEKLEDLCSKTHLLSKARGALQPKFLPVLAQADQSGAKNPEHQKLIIEIAMLRHSQVREDIRKHEDRQTQAYNFAIGVYGAELVAASTAITMALQAINGKASLALDDLV